jgi:hypothetical protein
VLRALGGAASGAALRMRQAVACRFATIAPADALPLIGDTRRLEQAPRETIDEYRVRLTQAFPIHIDRGTEMAYKHALEPIGVPPEQVFVWSHWQAGVGDWWSNVYIVVDSRETPWELDEWDGIDAEWDDGGVWDLNGLLADEVTFARRMIRRWKWSGDYPVAIWAWLSGEIWDDVSPWDVDGDVWGDVAGVALPILLGHTEDEEEWLYGDVPATWDDGSTWEEAFQE